MTSFYIFKHQDKGEPFMWALTQHGFTRTTNPARAGLLLADLERFGREKFLSLPHEREGTPTVLYPHGAVASCSWNFPGVKHFPFVKAVVVPAVGWTSIMHSYGCTYKTIECGWPFSHVRPFTRSSGKNILFAPIHPNSNGFLSLTDKSLNQHTFKKLLQLKAHTLTVRYLGDLSHNGLSEVDGVHFIKGTPRVNDSKTFMRDFDLVVGHHMFGYLSVAQGIPTLMFGEFVAPHYGGSEGEIIHVESWPIYKAEMMFPLDVLAEEDIHFLVERATYSDYEIADWKARMIGGPFNAELYVSEMEKIAHERTSNREQVDSITQAVQHAKEKGTWKGESFTEHVGAGPLQEGLRPETQQ